MRRIFLTVSGLTCAFALTLTGTASADTTLGTTTQPSASSTSGCDPSNIFNQVTSDASTPYSVPGAGTITQWQTNSATDGPGASVSLLVLKPVGVSFTVVGVDTRNIPNPAPPIATFSLAAPIAVSGGETLGLYSAGPVICYFHGGSTSSADTLARLFDPSPPSPPASGQTLNRNGPDSPGGYTMNLAATFRPTPPTPPPTGERAAALASCKKRARKHHWSHQRLRKCKKKANLLPV